MKPLTWGMKDEFGQPYRWDQKNVTWSGILEPGDPGYQAPESTPGYADTHPHPELASELGAISMG